MEEVEFILNLHVLTGPSWKVMCPAGWAGTGPALSASVAACDRLKRV